MHLLLVEDEPSLRKPTGKVLVRAGYVVLEAADGKDGLRRVYEELSA